ncbi:hypothetical protein ACFQ0R_00165 [Psychroflexus salinarum]|uniref:Uncharacterized protein n=1 Tax=Psychroflexus salinarum TaxID=546024 RepID=A0ABW3GQE7_9FLAO
MKTLIPSISLIFFSVNCLAQDTFKKSYYISTFKDTTSGFIKDYDWKNNPEQIVIKKH